MNKRPNLSARVALLVALSLIAVLLLVSFAATYREVKRALIEQESLNQQSITNIFSHSLSEYFNKLKLVTEYASKSPAFAPTRTNNRVDSVRFSIFWGDTVRLKEQGIIDSVLSPRSEINTTTALIRQPRVWQVFRGLPEQDGTGKVYADERRTMAETARRAFPDLHYVFEMDINGDMIFLHPFDEQRRISGFNYSFRDYLKQVRALRRTILSEGYISRDKDRTQIITVASPIFDKDSTITKLFAASVSAATLRKAVFVPLTRGIGRRGNTRIYLLDHHGHVVASSDDSNVYNPTDFAPTDSLDVGNIRSAGLLRRLRWTSGTLEGGNAIQRATASWVADASLRTMSDQYVNFDSINVIGTFLPISILAESPVRWGILVETPLENIQKQSNRLKIIFMLVAALLTLILAVLTFNLFRSFRAVEEELQRKETTIQEKQRKIIEIAERVSHDIRSPLVALDMLTQSLNLLPEDRRTKIRIAISRIQDIANDLVGDQHREFSEGIDASGRKTPIILMTSVLSDIISQKRIEYRPRIGLEIESDIRPESYGLFAAISPTTLGRIVSNVINNAVDAVKDRGTVRVSLSGNETSVCVAISDDGLGIDSGLLRRLGTERIRSQKGGQGLGLYDARRTLDELHGTLEVSSQLGSGTTVRIIIPRATPPRWFMPEIELVPGMIVVIVDDDQSIHQIWAERFSATELAGLDVRHYSSPGELLEFYANERPSCPRLFLVDYEYETRDGLSLIDELGISPDSALVTSHFENAEVLRRAEQIGVRVLPKTMAPYVPIRVCSHAADSAPNPSARPATPETTESI